jgi:dTDP-4-amino-4,6-dideoxygalactose transaminase
MKSARTIPFGRPWITEAEREAVMAVLQGHVLTHGPQGQAFEQEFAAFTGDEAHCVSVSSGMAALHLAYLHFGIGVGDEVIVPAQTHVATVHAVEWVGAQPVFVDCDPATGNVTATGIEAAISPRTKAVSVVHFVGIPCPMAAIMAVAEARGLKVIEDCALAVGAHHKGKHVGLWGDAGCFSFYPVKHITTGEGGMFITRHPEVAKSVAKLRAFGVDRSYAERTIPGIYDVPTLGLNYRMSEMQAALGRVQLGRVQDILTRRQVNFDTLKKGLSGIPGLTILDSHPPEDRNSHYCLSLVLDRASREQRDAVVSRLNAAGIGTSIYYPHPVPRLAYYRDKYGYDLSRFPQATRISDQSIALPVGPHLTEADLEYIIENFQLALGGTAK